MHTIVEKLKSDRLWALLLLLVLVLLNTLLGLNLEAVPAGATLSPLSEVALAVGTFILGKSIRGTVGGSMFTSMVDAFGKAAVHEIRPIPQNDTEGSPDPRA